MIDDKSEEGGVSLLDVVDSVVSVFDLGEDGEVVMVGEVSGLDVELEEGMSGGDLIDPDLLDLGVLQLGRIVVVVLVDLHHDEVPVAQDLGIHVNNQIAHRNKTIYI
jgi:hypothetical protein